MASLIEDKITEKDVKERLPEGGFQTVADSARESLRAAQETQEINKALANLPDEYELCGKKVVIKSASIRRRILIDAEIIKLQKLTFVSDIDEETITSNPEKAWEKLAAHNAAFWDQLVKTVVAILQDPSVSESEQITEADILDSDISNDGALSNIIRKYVYRNDASNFLKNLTGARSY